MKEEKANRMEEQLKRIITCHNNWIQNQKILKTSADSFDKAVNDLLKMIYEEVKKDEKTRND